MLGGNTCGARGATATLRSRMNTKIFLVSLALAVTAVGAAAASGVPTVCIAPTLESDAKKPLRKWTRWSFISTRVMFGPPIPWRSTALNLRP